MTVVDFHIYISLISWSSVYISPRAWNSNNRKLHNTYEPNIHVKRQDDQNNKVRWVKSPRTWHIQDTTWNTQTTKNINELLRLRQTPRVRRWLRNYCMRLYFTVTHTKITYLNTCLIFSNYPKILLHICYIAHHYHS